MIVRTNFILILAFFRCNWPRGKVLGGSSVLNYMLYVRGNKHDYQHWEEDGNPGWGYDEVRTHHKFSRILNFLLLLSVHGMVSRNFIQRTYEFFT